MAYALGLQAQHAKILEIRYSEGMAYDKKPSEYSVRIGAALKLIMKDEGITQAKVAQKIGRDQTYVSERLNGIRSVDTDMLDAVADALSISELELIARLHRVAAL